MPHLAARFDTEVLYLHGGSLRGDDPDIVRQWGVPARREQRSEGPIERRCLTGLRSP